LIFPGNYAIVIPGAFPPLGVEAVNINDFLKPEVSDFILTQTDLLVDQGMDRHTAERLITKISSVINGEFSALLDAFEDLEDLEERVFCKTGMIAYLNQWLAERLVHAALSQTLSFEVICRRGEA